MTRRPYDPARRWSYLEPDDIIVCEEHGLPDSECGCAGPYKTVSGGPGHVVTQTEQEILAVYWPYWSREMQKRHPDSPGLMSAENCIDDYIVVNWAWETGKEEG